MENVNGVSVEGIPFVSMMELHNDAPTGDDLFQMKLHDTFNMGWYRITRVPGGWLYQHEDASPTFVPLDNEFCTRRGV